MLGKSAQIGTTSDLAVLSSGVPVTVYAVNVVAGGSAGTIQLRNGTSDSASIYLTITSPANTGTIESFGTAGLTFPSGCFVDVGANVSNFTVVFDKIQ